MKKLAVTLIVIAMISAGIGTYSVIAAHRNVGNSTYFPAYTVVNLTSELGQYYQPGAIQAFGTNSTSILVSGISHYNKPTDTSKPALVQLTSLENSSLGVSLSNITGKYFHDGSVFGTAWNGTSWLLTGEINSGPSGTGAVISVRGNNITNLTPVLGKYFRHGGAWFDAWNGSSWLIGGNCDKEASLVSYSHGEVKNYSSLLGNSGGNPWIQLIEWNGTSWLIGGFGVFGFLKNGVYSNMLGMTEFATSGVFTAYYDGTGWMIGGGKPAGLQIVHNNGSIETLALPSYFNNWVNAICKLGSYYIIGGEAGIGPNRIAPALFAVNLTGKDPAFQNITSLLPGSFDYGLVQFMGDVQFEGANGILIAGQGNYDEVTGHSTGALALLSLPAYV